MDWEENIPSQSSFRTSGVLAFEEVWNGFGLDLCHDLEVTLLQGLNGGWKLHPWIEMSFQYSRPHRFFVALIFWNSCAFFKGSQISRLSKRLSLKKPAWWIDFLGHCSYLGPINFNQNLVIQIHLTTTSCHFLPDSTFVFHMSFL